MRFGPYNSYIFKYYIYCGIEKNITAIVMYSYYFLILFQNVRMSEIGDVVILDVDANELRSPFNDLETLPPELVSNFRAILFTLNVQ